MLGDDDDDDDGNASWLVLLPPWKGRRLTQRAGRAERLD